MNIIELAKEAGLPCQHPDWTEGYERFAALVRAEYEAPLKLALDFISRLKFADAEPEPDLVMAAIREALAEPVKQEPVAWDTGDELIPNNSPLMSDWIRENCKPLYAAPVQPNKQEPVAFVYVYEGGHVEFEDAVYGLPLGKSPLYAAPVQPVKQRSSSEHMEPVAWLKLNDAGYEITMAESDLRHLQPIEIQKSWANATPLYAAPVDAKAILETERKHHAFELSMQEELFADKAETIRAEALEEAAKVCEDYDSFYVESCAAAIRGLK